MCLVLTEGQEKDILEVAYAVNNKLEEGIFYRYSGPPAQRLFCRTLMSLDKLYTKQDINQMSFAGANSQFAPKGRSKYSIFNYRGGANCKHVWKKVEIINDEDGLPREYDRGIVSDTPVERLNYSNEDMDIYELILDEDNLDGVYGASLVAEPAIELEGIFFNNGKDVVKKEQPIKWQLSSEEKRIIVAPVLVPNKKIYRESIGKDKKQGLTFVSAETIEKLQQNFFKQKYNHNSTLEHLEVLDSVYFFESWIVIDPLNDKSNALGFQDLQTGTWMMAMKVENDDLWENYIKTGLVRGLSIDALLRPKKQEQGELATDKIKLKKMDKKTISAIINEAIQKVAMAAELQSFILEDGTEIKATGLDLDAVVTDLEGNAFLNKEFNLDGFDYKTDDFGVIISKEEVKAEEEVPAEEIAMEEDKKEEEVPAEEKEEEVKLEEDVVLDAPVEEDKDVIIADLNAKIVSLEEEIANLMADSVLREEEAVLLRANKPASNGIVDRPAIINYSSNGKKNESALDAISRINKLNKKK